MIHSHAFSFNAMSTVMTVHEHTAAAHLLSCVVGLSDDSGSASSLLGMRVDYEHVESFVSAFLLSYSSHMEANGYEEDEGADGTGTG